MGIFVWCCTLCETYIAKTPGFKFPHKYAGTHIEEYNEIIRNVVRCNDCKLIDLYRYRTPYDSVDGSHPTATGMNTIATMMIRSMIGLEADRFLDCENGQHDYKVVEEYTGGTRYVCSCCGKTMHKNTLSPDGSHNSQYKDGLTVDEANNRNNENETEYVMLNPETTAALYSDILPLTIISSGMLGDMDPTKLKVGDTFQPSKDVKMRILTLKLEDSVEFIPMFTSNEEVKKGPSASIIRFYPQDYLPKLVQMDKPVIVNPFSENRFFLSKQLITEVLLPLVEKKTVTQPNTEEQTEDKYIGKTIGSKLVPVKYFLNRFSKAY